MKVSKIPVQFANRAEMIECDAHAFSVGAYLPEPGACVLLNQYAPDGTRVTEMTPEEAEEIAGYLLKSAKSVREARQEARHAAQRDARVWQDGEPAQTAFTRPQAF